MPDQPDISILFKEILPNCYGPVFTKVSLDMGWVILLASALSFVGLGAQPPTPDPARGRRVRACHARKEVIAAEA